MVRFAGFRRLQPIVPDRTAFGAAIEGKTHRDHAENQCQTPEHGRLLPTPLSYGPKSGIFKPRRPDVHFRRMPSRMRMLVNRPEEPPFMQDEPQAKGFDIEEARRV